MSNATVLRHMDMLFPSPVGELHFSIIMAKKQYTIIKSFPSPVGELHFSISSSFVVVEVDSCFRPLSGNYISQFYESCPYVRNNKVSVPCRGTTFLNRWVATDENGKRCFRPLSGNYISQWARQFPISLTTFPSPVGELHFSIYL